MPLDRTFTYAVPESMRPERGARVIVPFRNEKLIGVVTALSSVAPAEFEARRRSANVIGLSRFVVEIPGSSRF